MRYRRPRPGHFLRAEFFPKRRCQFESVAAQPHLIPSELKRALGKVTHKMLSQQLKGMEADGIIYRKEYPQVPPKVEYGLTELGKSLMPILHEVCTWGQNHYTQR